MGMIRCGKNWKINASYIHEYKAIFNDVLIFGQKYGTLTERDGNGCDGYRPLMARASKDADNGDDYYVG